MMPKTDREESIPSLEPTGLRCAVARGQRAVDFALSARWLAFQPAAQRGRYAAA